MRHGVHMLERFVRLKREGRSRMTITYFAYVRNALGRIEQMHVTKEAGKASQPRWTGIIYKSERIADADTAKLNSEITLRTRSYERVFGAA
jgi:hypothetical protein